MKKLICAILIALTIGGCALAASAPKLSGKLIPAAKQAAVCLAKGEYDRLEKSLPFSGTAPGAGEWQRFARSFTRSGGAQTDYAVAYWYGENWRVAVPMQTPADGGVEVLMLISGDGESFSGYRYVTWSQVESELHASEHVVWDREYLGAAPRVFAD